MRRNAVGMSRMQRRFKQKRRGISRKCPLDDFFCGVEKCKIATTIGASMVEANPFSVRVSVIIRLIDKLDDHLLLLGGK